MDIASIREDFPILKRRVYGKPLVYLDNAATTHKPQAVLDRVIEHYTQNNANVHRGAHALADAAANAYESARERVANFIGAAQSTEIIFTRGTTESINLVAASFGETFVQQGDEILITAMEHHANIIPWQQLCKKRKARIRVAPLDENGALCIDKIGTLITDKTRLVALTHVSNVTGIVNPVEQVIGIAHAQGVPVLVDGAQAAPHIPIDVQTLDCDFYAFSGHKIYAETGVGILYGKGKWLDKMPPYQTGGGIVTSVNFDQTLFEKAPLKFEAGTANIGGAVSLAAALDYVTGIGLSQIASHEKALLRRLRKGLGALDGVTAYGNSPHGCGSISFNLDGIHPTDVSLVLDKMGIAVRAGTHCAEPLVKTFSPHGTVRASVAMYNTPEEIDSLLSGLERVASVLSV